MDSSTEILYQLKEQIESLQSDKHDDYIRLVSIIVNYNLSQTFERMLIDQLIYKFNVNIVEKLRRKAWKEDERAKGLFICDNSNGKIAADRISCCQLHLAEIIGFRSDIIQLEYIKLKKIDINTLKHDTHIIYDTIKLW